MNWAQRLLLWILFRDLETREDLQNLMQHRAHIHLNPKRKQIGEALADESPGEITAGEIK